VVSDVSGFLRGCDEKTTDTTDGVSDVSGLIESILCFKEERKLVVEKWRKV
jgi:hypothetical protein